MNEPQGGPPAIVVGIDGSEDSKHALRWAAQQAELTNAPLHVITAWQYPVDFGTAWQIPATYGRSHDFSHVDFSEDAKKTLDGVIEEVLGKDPRVTVAPQLVRGHPAQVLIEASRQAGLLAVGASGHGGFVGMLLGSVTQHCVGHSACPVVVIRRPAQK
jgi:nucleotide-binding universal stress UspA family protein